MDRSLGIYPVIEEQDLVFSRVIVLLRLGTLVRRTCLRNDPVGWGLLGAAATQEALKLFHGGLRRGRVPKPLRLGRFGTRIVISSDELRQFLPKAFKVFPRTHRSFTSWLGSALVRTTIAFAELPPTYPINCYAALDSSVPPSRRCQSPWPRDAHPREPRWARRAR